MAKKKQREDVINYTEADRYVVPKEPEVRAKLEWFKDQKLAFMVHWGVYSELGMCESWPLSDGDAYWARKDYTWEKDPQKFRKIYFDMNKTFNPIRFNPDEWADFAKAAGFKYFIFTTKHHDGFCMFDTKYSDYKITAPDCPFSGNARKNIAKELFDAFRARGIAIAPYFSKPDWHCPWYWADGCEKPIAFDRNPTYDPKKRPELWEKYVEFTHNQLLELVQDYGPVDILWLDGGQVNPINNQDIRIEELAAKVRAIKSDIIFADRTVGGACENYITPEHMVPDHMITVPWESCIPVGGGFAYGYDDHFKTPGKLVELLIQVTTRGGNLALNLGGQPDGRLPRRGMESCLGLGKWLEKHGEAIYGTRAVESEYESGDFGFNKKGDTVYALLPLEENGMPAKELLVPWSGKVNKITDITTGANVEFAAVENGCKVTLPDAFFAASPLALVLKMD